tara:strand:+ start:2900 stop:3094 length:195 start_codon:yes stop_codon:yes gene_type:complete
MTQPWFGTFYYWDEDGRYDVEIETKYPCKASRDVALERIIKSGRSGMVRYTGGPAVAGYIRSGD